MEINQNPLNGEATLTKHGEDSIRVHNPPAPARSTPLRLHRQRGLGQGHDRGHRGQDLPDRHLSFSLAEASSELHS